MRIFGSARALRPGTSLWLTGLRNPLALVSARDRSVLVGDWGTGIIYTIRSRTG